MTREPVHLTPRERLILTYRALGKTNPDIATELGVSVQTVKNHLFATYRKTGALCLVDALRAIGWLVVPEPKHVSADG